MEKRKRVRISVEFEKDIQRIYEYGVETFGLSVAEEYKQDIMALTYGLCDFYLMYPECRHMITRGRIYRNIILEAHLVIYRIQEDTVDVLRIFHSHSSITRIRSARGIRI